MGVLAAIVFALSIVTRALLLRGPWRLAGQPVARGRARIRGGRGYDAAVTLWLLLPLMLYLTIATSSWLARRANRVAPVRDGRVAIGGALFVAVAELLFFAEFDGRFNFVAVDYLIYPTEVVNNIWESYPTGWIVAGNRARRGRRGVLSRRRRSARRSTRSAPLRATTRVARRYVVVLAALSSCRAAQARPRLG